MEESSNSSELPNFIYVSELLRTWETAVLLFLRDSINLTLFISPYLRESGPIDFTSDRPGKLKEQFKEFIRFIVFLRKLKKLNINGISSEIPDNFTITLKHFAGLFSEEFIQNIEIPGGIELEVRDGGIVITCTNVETGTDKSEMTESMNNMLSQIDVDEESKYVPYVDDSSQLDLKFPPKSSKSKLGNMDTPSTPSASIADFIEWYNNFETKPHGEGIVYFVAHSGTMKKFIEQIEQVNKKNQKPSEQFNNEYREAIETNTWSLFFKTGDRNVFKGFRHAYSCDNRYMDKGFNLFNPFNFYTNFVKQRWKGGHYTNLSLWGIFSTLKFSSEKMQILVDDQSISSSTGLKICKGMKTEPQEYHGANYDNINPLCGQQRDRMPTKTFSVDFGHCGTLKKTMLLTFNNDCIRIITDPKGAKVVLYLDKEKQQIEARFFRSAITSKKYYEKITLTTQEINDQLTQVVKHLIKITDENKKEELVDDLKNAVSLFIINKKLTQWESAFNILFPEPQQVSEEVLPQPEPPAVPVHAGGTIKRTQRRRYRHIHKKHKVIKKYTRKYKKNNPRRKSRRIQKRKQTHKRKSRKSRK